MGTVGDAGTGDDFEGMAVKVGEDAFAGGLAAAAADAAADVLVADVDFFGLDTGGVQFFRDQAKSGVDAAAGIGASVDE